MSSFTMAKQNTITQISAAPTTVGAAASGPPVATTVSDLQIPTNIIQTRELLYRLIISQLFYDGYQQVAVTLSNMGKCSDYADPDPHPGPYYNS